MCRPGVKLCRCWSWGPALTVSIPERRISIFTVQCLDIPVSLSIPSVVQDLTSNTAGTLDATAWGNLKSNHYATISSPTMTGLDSTYEFVNIKLSINSTNQYVKLGKNTTNKYSGLFFIEESTNLYEITAYYNGTNIILRCATVY